MTEENKLIVRDYQTALDVQCASNLCGVAQSFATVMRKIAAETNSTDAANQHPIARLYAEQILHLTAGGMGHTDTYSAAYDVVTAKIAELGG